MSYLRSSTVGPASFMVASGFPAIVIIIELISGLCAGTFFDPMPTMGHLLLVAAVPTINALLWRAVSHEEDGPTWLLLAGGASVVISASYSLLFLPILPFAFIAILLLGLGLLPFGPLIALVYAWKWTLELSGRHERPGLRILAGAALGLAALILVDLPATATQVALGQYAGDAEKRRSAVGLMRALGDRDMLLRLSYGDTARATGVASFLVSAWSNGPFWSEAPRAAPARELYYLVTGQAFNAVPRPGHGPGSRVRLFGWDEDQGGDAVGGRVPDLALVGSRIDGSVAERDNLAQLEWTFDIANTGSSPSEARFTLALPEGSVASRATLWVNGEPREASIAGRGATRAAYQSVVRSARDPLLVTTDGAQRLLVQAFPIAAQTTMRLRIGITSPFQIAADGRRSLALPAMVERNFDLPDRFRHTVWIDGDAPLGGPARSDLSDARLLAQRPAITLTRIMSPRVTTGGVPATHNAPALAISQRIDRVDAVSGPLMMVVDASADTEGAQGGLARALDAIAPGLPVGLVIAGDEPRLVAPAPWSPVQAKRVGDALRSARFESGRDGRPALALALAQIPRRDATVLWVHGAQPVRFAWPDPTLEQALERLPALPQLVRYQVTPGRALALLQSPWFDTARLPAPTGDIEGDLRRILAHVAARGSRWVVTHERSGPTVAGSGNIVRLWGTKMLAGQAPTRGKDREAAIALANRLNLVTPVSGAVVLEAEKDYQANGLPVPDPDAVPTVPEPGVWALLFLLAIAGAYVIRLPKRAVLA